MNLARFILRALNDEGIDCFFMVPGKLINPFMSCYSHDEQEAIRPVIAAFEGGAMMMADGYARASGRFGVAILLDGPGVANAVGGVANAFADGYPVLLLAGQTSTGYEMIGALQDSTQSGANMAAVLKPLSRYAFNVRHIDDARRYVSQVIKSMYHPEKMPCFLSFAKDVLLQDVSGEPFGHQRDFAASRLADTARLDETFAGITSGESLAILVGGRANRPDVFSLLQSILERYAVPVAVTLSAKGVMPEDHHCYLGVYGYAGHHRAINMLTEQQPDYLILLGFETTQWTSLVWEKRIQPNKKLIQIGARLHDLNYVIPADVSIQADEYTALEQMIHSGVLERTHQANLRYLNAARELPLCYPIEEQTSTSTINPAEAIQLINKVMAQAICIADSGNHRAFTTHYWLTSVANGFYSANTLCGMGWAIPASIGVSLARNQPCVVITGDGCMLMHGMEIQTAARYNRDILYIVMNNACYGATWFNNRNNIDDMSRLPDHDWSTFARGFHIPARRVTTLEELQDALLEKRLHQGTFLIDVVCNYQPETPVREYKTRLNQRGVL